jgi:hypothetical protein
VTSARVPDTTFVDLHRLTAAVRVEAVEGQAVKVDSEHDLVSPLVAGLLLEVGDTIALEAGATVRAGSLVLSGGRRGHAHSFVPHDAFKSSPGRADVPRLVAELEQIERRVVSDTGGDPLAAHTPPEGPFLRALARDFALANLSAEAARELPAALGRAERSVCLFSSGDTAHVALGRISLKKLRLLMRTLGRPVSPHMVDEQTLDLLLDAVYGAP